MRCRRTSATVAVVILALLGSACSKSSGESADSGKVTLTFWGTYGNGGNKAQTSVLNGTLIPAFEKAHPNIKITYVDIPYDSLLQKLETSAAGNKLPDLLRSDIAWVPKFGALGVFAPLDQTMSDFQTFADAIYPGTLATNKWKDHYYGLPLDTNTRVLFSNPDVLSRAGLTAPPATFDDFRAMAAKLAGQNGIDAFADSGLGMWNMLPWIWSGGGDITNPDLTRASGYLDSDASVAAVQMLVDLYKQKAIPNLIIGNKGATSTSDGLPKAKYATILDGPWMYGIWQGQYPKFAPKASPMPAGPGGSVSVVGGEDIVMTSTSTHQKEAEEFIRFTQSADYQLAMVKTGQMSVVKSLGDQEATLEPFYAPYIAQLATARPRPPVPAAPKIDTALNDNLVKAFKGQTSVRDALSAAAKQIDKLLVQVN